MEKLILTSHLLKHQQEQLRHLLTILLEADEPEAILSSIRRIAERKAHDMTRNQTDNEIQRWYNLAEALMKVEKELKIRNITLD